MSVETWLVYLGTVLLLMSTPGPSHLLMLSNSISNGFNKSIATAAGDLTANFFQMVAASVGLVGILVQFQQYFVLLKWAGVGYLIYLGLKLLISTHADKASDAGGVRSIKSLYWQGFFTSAANPKAIIFFAALFPQFISAADPLLPQFTALCITYLVIDGTFLCFYGTSADIIVRRLDSSFRRYYNKIAGSLLIAVAVLLGLKDFENSS